MSAACSSLVDDGVIRGVLATVDCQTKVYAQGGYQALTSGSGIFQTALTALLTIYVALIGFRLLFAQGDMRLSDAPGIALKIGAILALVTSWSTFQTLVFDVAERAPVEIAAVISSPLQAGGGSALAAHPVDGLQAAYDEFSQTSLAYGRAAGTAAKSYSSPQAAAAEATSTATGVLFLSGAGVISAATLAIGVLTAVGPLFIALALIPATRGLFMGWVRALGAAALTPLVAWLLVVLMLSVLEPWIVTLGDQRRSLQLEPQTAMSAAALVFVFGFGQAVLVMGACIMALGFQLPRLGGNRTRTAAEAPRPSSPQVTAVLDSPSRAERLAMDLQRDQAQSAGRARAAMLAASAGVARRVSVNVDATPRLGDTYRRPAITTRRAENAR